MTDFERDHPDLDRLGDHLDGILSLESMRAVEAHLAICSVCSERRDRLDSLVAAARALPDKIDPPVELWSGVRTRIERAPARARQFWLLAAAAVVLVAASSAVTALIVRRQMLVGRPNVAPAITVAQLSPAARAIDADYAAAIQALNETLAENRSRLDPATVAKVEASLHVIDHAIDEARQALAADPSDITLLDLLASSYERKVELLRRANALLLRT